MRFLFLILLTLPFNLNAKEVITAFFKIDLPDSFQVETDRERRILAFDKNHQSQLPFLSIEFGKTIDFGMLKTEVNQSIKSFGVELAEEPCNKKCQAYYVEFSMFMEKQKINRYHYLIQSENIIFMISFGDIQDIEVGRNFVKNIGLQILQNGI